MNLATIKQLFLNNLWYGEQKRGGVKMPAEMMSLVAPDNSRPWGTDISPWDGNVNLYSTKAMGAKFVFIKAIDGTIQARYFVENRARAKDAGLLDGPYGWLYRDANVSCVAQAQAYDALLDKYPMTLPPGIDFEPTKWGGVASNPTFTDLRKWVTEWLRLGNRKPILYSAAYYMNQFGKIPDDLKAMFEGIWIAHYGTNTPAMPLGYSGGDWLFHQFTSSGDAVSISPNDVNKKEVDLNYSVSVDRLYQLAGAIPPVGGTMLYGKVSDNVAALNIRSGPGASYLDVGDLIAGDVLEATENVNGWWHLKSATRNGAPVVTSDGRAVSARTDCWASGTYITPTEAPAGSIMVSHIFDDTMVVNGKEYTAHFEVPNVEYKPKP